MSEATLVNYTDLQTTQAVQAYKAGETVERIAQALNKTTRSVVAKLVSEGVYVSKARADKTAAPTKAKLIETLELNMLTEPGAFKSFEKADKAALQELVSQFVALRQAYDIVVAGTAEGQEK